ncbi:hypothetical protein D3C78_1845980 [compost metagenome]
MTTTAEITLNNTPKKNIAESIENRGRRCFWLLMGVGIVLSKRLDILDFKSYLVACIFISSGEDS